jgi:hypothetical protein
MAEHSTAATASRQAAGRVMARYRARIAAAVSSQMSRKWVSKMLATI